MGKDTGIEYVDSTWNPWMGCTKISEGCKHCYMFRWAKRTGRDPTVVTKSKTTSRDPLKWKEPRRILTCSLSDFFHEDVDPEWRRDAWEIMFHAKEHTFMVLTKRPENMPDMLPAGWIEGMWKYYPNIWLGVTAENQAMANLRVPLLMPIPAKVRYISAEPLLGPIDFTEAMYGEETFGMNCFGFTDGFGEEAYIQLVIAGGESGSDRVMEPRWVQEIRDQCIGAKVPFTFKQWGGKGRDPQGIWGGKKLDGRTWSDMPNDQ